MVALYLTVFGRLLAIVSIMPLFDSLKFTSIAFFYRAASRVRLGIHDLAVLDFEGDHKLLAGKMTIAPLSVT